MSTYEITLVLLSTNELPSLQPFVDAFVATHRSLRFKESYWDSFQQWLLKKKGDPDILVLAAHVDGKLPGFGLGTTQEIGPSPKEIGYVSLLGCCSTVSKRRCGKGAVERHARLVLVQREVELYAEVGNELSSRFWDRRGFQPLLVRRRQNIGRASTPP